MSHGSGRSGAPRGSRGLYQRQPVANTPSTCPCPAAQSATSAGPAYVPGASSWPGRLSFKMLALPSAADGRPGPSWGHAATGDDRGRPTLTNEVVTEDEQAVKDVPNKGADRRGYGRGATHFQPKL